MRSLGVDLAPQPARTSCAILEWHADRLTSSGDGRVYETYPALGLHLWGMQSRGYKGAGKDEVRAAVWGALGLEEGWITMPKPDALASLAPPW